MGLAYFPFLFMYCVLVFATLQRKPAISAGDAFDAEWTHRMHSNESALDVCWCSGKFYFGTRR